MAGKCTITLTIATTEDAFRSIQKKETERIITAGMVREAAERRKWLKDDDEAYFEALYKLVMIPLANRECVVLDGSEMTEALKEDLLQALRNTADWLDLDSQESDSSCILVYSKDRQ